MKMHTHLEHLKGVILVVESQERWIFWALQILPYKQIPPCSCSYIGYLCLTWGCYKGAN